MNPGRVGMIAAPSYPMLKDSTMRALFDVLDYEGISYDYHKTEYLITILDTQSQIMLRSLDKPERLRGPNLAWAAVDEATYCKKDSVQRLEARLRDPHATRICLFMVWTPKGYDWVWERFVDKPRSDHHYTHGSPRENFYTDKTGLYDRLEQSYDARFYQQEVGGEYLNIASGQVYYAFDRKRHIAPQEWTPGVTLCWALDFNVNPMCSVICQVIDGTTNYDRMNGKSFKKIVVLDEICLPDSHINQACTEFVRRTEKWTKNGPLVVKLYGDATGRQRQHGGSTNWNIVKDFFAFQSGYRVDSNSVDRANPAIKDRVNSFNAALSNARGEQSVYMDMKCNELRKDCEQGVWKTDMNGNLTGEIDDKDSKRMHVSSALGYMIWKELPVVSKGGFSNKGVY